MNDVSSKRYWDAPIKAWRKKVAPFGCAITRSPAAYEIAKVTGPGVSLIIYAHKQGHETHHSARVRNNNSKDVEMARRVIAALHLWCKEDCHLYMYGYQGPLKARASAPPPSPNRPDQPTQRETT